MRATLPETYARRVDEGQLRADPAQRAVMVRLEELREMLEQQAQRPRGGLRGLFARAPAAPRGVYLWGGVGRGKSMLMDLFFEELGIAAKRRVHFHAFMQEVHRGMHEARARAMSKTRWSLWHARSPRTCAASASTRCRSPTSPMR